MYLLNNILIHLMHRLAENGYILRGVRADKYRLPLLLVTEQVLSHFGNTLFIETVERLVKYQYLRVFHYRLRQTEALTHTE